MYCIADLTSDIGIRFGIQRGADPSRIAVQIVSGIGFIGVGVIFKNGNSIKGLTTAAGIWATAAIGMAIGSGMYLTGVFATLLVLFSQIIMHRFRVGNDSYSTNTVTIVGDDSAAVRDWTIKLFGELHIPILDGQIHRNGDGTASYQLSLRISNKMDFGVLSRILNENEGVRLLHYAVEY